MCRADSADHCIESITGKPMPMCTAVSSRITLISDQITTRASHTLLGSSSVAFQTSIFTFIYVKFIFSEKDIKFCEISTVLLAYVVPVKSKVEISKNFVAFSEYMNFRSTYLGRNSKLCISDRTLGAT